LILKELLRDRHIPPTRQSPSFVLPPLSPRLEAVGQVQSETEDTWELARLMLPAFGGSLRHRLEGEDPSG